MLGIYHWLYCTYGFTYPQEIADNEQKLMQPWDPNTPFAMLVERFWECQQFAINDNNPFTKPQLINKILHLIIQTETFPYDVWEWNNLDNNNEMFPNIIIHFTEAEMPQWQLLGIQAPHKQNIQQQAGDLSIQAKSIAATAKAIHDKNTTLPEENTNLQTKIHLHKEHINVITAQLQLQMQMVVQAFATNAQTMGSHGHNNTQCNKCSGCAGGHVGTTTPNTVPPIMNHTPVFNQSPFPSYPLVPPASSH